MSVIVGGNGPVVRVISRFVDMSPPPFFFSFTLVGAHAPQEREQKLCCVLFCFTDALMRSDRRTLLVISHRLTKRRTRLLKR